MPLGLNPDVELEPLQPKRTKTLLVSLGIHLMLIVFIVLDPGFLSGPSKRIIRIAGQDYDLSKTDLTELVMPPAPSASAKQPPAAEQPLVQLPPTPEAPPPPPLPPPAPPVTISPEDIIAEGARPDGQSRASQGTTQEQARVGSAPQEPKPEAQPPEPRGDAGKTQMARNTNPDAMRLPNLLDRAGRIVDASVEETRKRYIQHGPQTGIPRGIPENPNFSTEEPTILSDTRGYDFGPYMNQVVNRVRINWYSVIPEIARLGKKGRVVIIFTITESGAVTDLRLVANSGADPLDRAAQASITASNPFQKLPANFEGDHLVLQFTFLYNLQ